MEYDLLGPDSYGINNIFKALLIQHLEDLSDRELSRYLKENNASKWFCQFRLTAITPDHTVFTRARKKIGANLLSKIFAEIRDNLKQQGYINEVFTFIDASHLISKSNLWQERDKAIAKKI